MSTRDRLALGLLQWACSALCAYIICLLVWGDHKDWLVYVGVSLAVASLGINTYDDWSR